MMKGKKGVVISCMVVKKKGNCHCCSHGCHKSCGGEREVVIIVRGELWWLLFVVVR